MFVSVIETVFIFFLADFYLLPFVWRAAQRKLKTMKKLNQIWWFKHREAILLIALIFVLFILVLDAAEMVLNQLTQ